jgi:hypothetical protein
MTIKTQVNRFDHSVKDFARCIEALSEKSFLAKLNGWSPRDILAHLIGWNRYTITGCEQIRKGQIPFYFIDPGDDFSKVNAVLVQQYAATDQKELLGELEVSAQALKQYLLSLTPTEWEADYGVRYAGSPITIRNSVEALLEDYIAHRQEIEEQGGGSLSA